MPTIRITRPHQLSHDEVRAHVEGLAVELHQQLDASYHWDGDTLRFSRSGASGWIEVGKDSVVVEVKLSMLLGPFKHKIEHAVNEYLDRHLA